MSDAKLKVAFLDRDGVINKEVNYLHRIDEFQYTPNCIEGLKKLQNLGYQFIVITNQAGIARGYYTERDYHSLTGWYINDLKHKGIEILDVFYCPHHPEGIVERYSVICNCRKPQYGLLTVSSEKYSIDMNLSILIGDKKSDVVAGSSFGLTNNFLVRTGHLVNGVSSYLIFDDILMIANYVEKMLGSLLKK